MDMGCVNQWVELGWVRCYYFTLLCTSQKLKIKVDDQAPSPKHGSRSHIQVDCH